MPRDKSKRQWHDGEVFWDILDEEDSFILVEHWSAIRIIHKLCKSHMWFITYGCGICGADIPKNLITKLKLLKKPLRS